MQVRNWIGMVISLTLVLGAMETRGPSAWAQQTPDQQDHRHGAPHGGQMVTAGTYHLELVVQEHQTVQVYLYDETLKPVQVPAPEATLYLRLPGNKNHTLTLKALGGETATSWATTTDVLRDTPTFEAALRVIRPGGTLSSLGVYSTDLRIPLGPFAAGLGDHKIVTTLCPGGKERMRRLMEVIRSGRVDLKPMVTHRFKLDEIEAAYDLFGHQRDGVLKVAITP